MTEKIIFQAQVDVDEAIKNAAKLQQEVNRLRAERAELDKSYKQGLITEEAYAKQQVILQRQLTNTNAEFKAVTSEINLNDKATKANANSYVQVSAQLAIAQKRLKELGGTLKIAEDGTVELTEEFKEQAEAVRLLKDQQLAFDAAIKDGQTNVGNYGEAFQGSLGDVKIFGTSINDVKGGIDGLKAGIPTVNSLFGSIKAGIASTGVGLLLIAFASLAAFFTRTQKGADLLQKSLAGVGFIVQKILEPIIALGEALATGLVSGIETIGKVAVSLGLVSEESRSAVAEVVELEQALIDVQNALRDEGVEIAALRTQQIELKNAFEDTSLSFDERRKALQKANALEEEAQRRELALRQRNVEILQRQFEIAGDIQKDEGKLADLRQAQLELLAAQEKSLGLQNEKLKAGLALEQERLGVLNQISAANLELELLQGKIVEGSGAELNARKELVKQQFDLQIQATKEGTEQRQLLETQLNVELLKLDKDFRQKQLAASKEFNDKQKELVVKRLGEEVAAARIAEIEAQNAALAGGEARQQAALAATKARIEAELKERLNGIKRGSQAEALARLEAQQQILALEADFAQRQVDEEIKRREERRARQSAERQSELNAQIAFNQAAINEARARFENTFQLEQQQAAALLEQRLENLRIELESGKLTRDEFRALELEAITAFEAASVDARLAEQQRLLDAEGEIARLRLQVASDFVGVLEGIADEGTAVSRAAFLVQKKIALAEAFLNLQQELSNQNLAASKLDAVVPGSGIVYRIAAIARALSTGAKIFSEIRGAGFAEGGEVESRYTGHGGKYQPAGIVHKGEYVWSQKDVRLAGGVRAIEAIRPTLTQGRGQFFTGGFVGAVGQNAVATTQSNATTIENFRFLLENLPPPQVAVGEINAVQNKVQVIEEFGQR